MDLLRGMQLQYLLNGSNKPQDIATKMFILQTQFSENSLDIDSIIGKSGAEIAKQLEKAIQDSLNR
jgi:hypothetical protein